MDSSGHYGSLRYNGQIILATLSVEGTPTTAETQLLDLAKVRLERTLAVQKEIKHQMQLDYLRTGRGRPHIEWRW